MAKSRHIKGRAIWYDQMKAHILSEDELKELKNAAEDYDEADDIEEVEVNEQD